MTGTDAAPLLEAGALDETGLEGSTGLSWEPVEGATDDTDLPACADLTTVGEGPLAAVVAEERSGSFAGEVPGGPTTTSASVRGAVLVYADDSSAEAALAAVDAGLLATCIAPSVTEGAAAEIEVEEGGAPTAGDDGVALASELDDYVFFGGNDNFHRTELVVARTGPVLVVVQVIASSQSFEGVDVGAVAHDAAVHAVAGVEEAR
ncbi:hypothetical protein PO878_05200 [Iamia majanohamensis]|uniref:Uncharacterized protein n=1 Tax=Iamia majanohamensis TaxID=467976 RepID=A0AAE9Y7G0_9ACTN|nr:hypothetical protein [Iamia majanohamensis]WCO68119.1 hypothetical protein PO878_05200 [Iamia majanohamensis]